MIITIPWLKEHLKTKANEAKIIEQLTNIGLEVEGIKESSDKLREFKVAKILKTEKHPNADKLKVCDVSLGDDKVIKVYKFVNAWPQAIAAIDLSSASATEIESFEVTYRYQHFLASDVNSGGEFAVEVSLSI